MDASGPPPDADRLMRRQRLLADRARAYAARLRRRTRTVRDDRIPALVWRRRPAQ
jgi:hypothetical protein